MVTSQQIKPRREPITWWDPVEAQQGVGEDISLNFASRDETHQMKGLGVGRWKGVMVVRAMRPFQEEELACENPSDLLTLLCPSPAAPWTRVGINTGWMHE